MWEDWKSGFGSNISCRWSYYDGCRYFVNDGEFVISPAFCFSTHFGQRGSSMAVALAKAVFAVVVVFSFQTWKQRKNKCYIFRKDLSLETHWFSISSKPKQVFKLKALPKKFPHNFFILWKKNASDNHEIFNTKSQLSVSTKKCITHHKLALVSMKQIIARMIWFRLFTHILMKKNVQFRKKKETIVHCKFPAQLTPHTEKVSCR